MPNGPQAAYEFGQFTLIPTEKRLLCGEEEIALAPKVFDTLVLLVENPGRLIRKDELLRTLWPDTVVEEVGLAHNVSQLRKVLGDRAEDPEFIETVPKLGYRFIAPVRMLGEPAPRPTSPARGGAAPSAARHRAWSRPAMLAASAAGLLLISVAAGYLYLPHAGQRAARDVPAIRWLAVLPLEDLSGDKEQEYFADGMTDALITDLAQVGSLRVISRTSAMQFKGSKKTLPQIGHDLQVDAVVEGTVVRSDGRVRITAQLVEVGSDHHLWAKSYERDLKDVLALQDEIAQDVAEQIRVNLSPKERSRLQQTHTVDPAAHDLYLRGRYWWRKSTPEDERKGLDYFQQAIAKDPNYALAYSGVADSFVWLAHHGGLPPKEALPKAKEAAIKALALDPSLAEAHTSLAIVKFTYDSDWSGAEEEFKEAIALNPNWATTHHWYSHYLVAMGRPDEGVKEIERARDLDPYSLPINTWLGVTFYFARRYDDALRQCQQLLEMFPEHAAVFYNQMASVYEQKRVFAEAFAARQQALILNRDSTVNALGEAYQRSGYRGYVLKKIEILEATPRLDGSAVSDMAHWYQLLNDEDQAMSYFERSYDQGNPWVLYVQADPANDFMRSSPRFRALVGRIGLPPSSTDKNPWPSR